MLFIFGSKINMLDMRHTVVYTQMLNYIKQTMRQFCRYTLILIGFCCSNKLFGQDTIIYRGFADRILYESIELYTDKTFKWTSEYDLSLSEYGLYEIDNNSLQLKYFIKFNYPKTMSLKDSIILIENPIKIENFKLDKEHLYRLNKSGREIHRISDNSIRTCWSLIFGHKYELKK